VRKVEPKVSTIPFDRPDPAEVRAMEQRQQRNREQIERDADRDAAMSSQRPYADEAMRAWRDRCYAERRVDCDGPAPSYLYGPGFGLAPVYGGAYRPPAVRPRPPIAWFPGNAPPGFRVGPGPFDVGGAYVPLPEQTPYTPMRSPGPIQPR
jgi:hypothetical protein